MIEDTDRSRSKRPIVVSILAVAAAAAIAFGVSQFAGDDSRDDQTVATTDGSAGSGSEKPDADDATVGTTGLLDEPLGGQAAIDALGDKLDVVAQKNGKTVQELKDLLLRDETLRISKSGFLYYLDTAVPAPAD